MTKEKEMIPIEDVAIMCERAYRRGYQQGYTLSEAYVLPAIPLHTWRFRKSIKKAICPDTGRVIWGVETPLDRLRLEEHGYFEKAYLKHIRESLK